MDAADEGPPMGRLTRSHLAGAATGAVVLAGAAWTGDRVGTTPQQWWDGPTSPRVGGDSWWDLVGVPTVVVVVCAAVFLLFEVLAFLCGAAAGGLPEGLRPWVYRGQQVAYEPWARTQAGVTPDVQPMDLTRAGFDAMFAPPALGALPMPNVPPALDGR